ncbi:MAG: phage holin family protein [Firmicutes bacterium]|nr:phage holin family protein [Bacillota bacterium]
MLWVATALTFFVLARYHWGVAVSSLGVALWASLILGLVNLVVRPIARLLALPLTVLTLGLFGWAINALMLELVSVFVPGFRVLGFWPAIETALVLAGVAGVVNWLFRRRMR